MVCEMFKWYLTILARNFNAEVTVAKVEDFLGTYTARITK